MSRNHRSIRFALILAAAAVAGAVLGAKHYAQSTECTDGPARRLGAWNPAMRSGVKSAFHEIAWGTRVLEGFDRASRQWEVAYHAACTKHDAAKLACLDRALDRMRGLATSLAGVSDAKTMPDAPAGQPSQLAPRITAPWEVAALGADCEPVVDPHAQLASVAAALAAGDLGGAEAMIATARDRAIDIYGDQHPELAAFDDVLADVLRSRGKLRAALGLAEQSEHLRVAAFGASDPRVAASLYHRALVHLEGGAIGLAEKDLHRAQAIGGNPNELYAALAACDLARGDRDSARDHLAKTTAPAPAPPPPYRDTLTPAMIVAIATSPDQFATALDHLANEPNRTALAAALGLAKSNDIRSGQAARTAVQLYLAMPELDRAELPLAQELAKKP